MKQSRSPFLVGLMLLVGVAIFYFLFFYPPPKMAWKNVEIVKKNNAPQYFSALNGEPVTSTADIYPRVIAVMVDNHPDARPQSGLSIASVVYEAPVEGGFTRYFALFSSDQAVDKVGPVRSARPYFLDWLSEYGTPVYLHSGGSPDALTEIKRRGLFDANEFYWGEYYWRGDEADPPHNLFTKSNLWQTLAEKFGASHPTTTWSSWVFNDTPAVTSSSVKAISIHYTADYTVGWRYESDRQKYQRLINGQLFSDRELRPVSADNIIILEMPVQVLDEEGRKAIATVGAGSARVVRRGKLIRGTWKKTAVGDRTRVYDMNGNEVTLVPGKTWVEILPPATTIEVTQ